MEKYIFTKKITGTGEEIEVESFFTPAKVEVIDRNNGNQLIWVDTMDAGSGLKMINSGSAMVSEFITSGGITLTSSNDDFIGFKIGDDTDINVLTHIYDVVAFRN